MAYKGKTLVIVESPSKIKYFEKWLGTDAFQILATCGHMYDVSSKDKWLLPHRDSDYDPRTIPYCKNKTKQAYIKRLRDAARNVARVLYATDNDREGDAIACIIDSQLLKDLKVPRERILFNEITSGAIKAAVAQPVPMDSRNTLFRAQQARRVLDFMFGFGLSRALPSQFKTGRCQGPALRWMCQRQDELLAFDPNRVDSEQRENAFAIKVTLHHDGTRSLTDVAAAAADDSDNTVHATPWPTARAGARSQAEAEQRLVHLSRVRAWRVCELEPLADVSTSPPEPFTTSALQRRSHAKFRWGLQRTMRVAQKLYENGYITYMRTDCKKFSNEFANEARQFIGATHGEEYVRGSQAAAAAAAAASNLSSTVAVTAAAAATATPKKQKGAQEAHEPIRPTKLNVPKLEQAVHGTDGGVEAQLLYRLIYEHTLASLMPAAIDARERILMEPADDDLPGASREDAGKLAHVASRERFDGWRRAFRSRSTGAAPASASASASADEDEDEDADEDADDKDVEAGEKDADAQPPPPTRVWEIGQRLPARKYVAREKTRTPPRPYNSADLVRLFETRGIGRPSTYSSLVNRLAEHGYITSDEQVWSTLLTKLPPLASRTLSIAPGDARVCTTEVTRSWLSHVRNRFMVTPTGMQLGQMLRDHFAPLVADAFTSQMERGLEAIARGEALYPSVVRTFDAQLQELIQKKNLVMGGASGGGGGGGGGDSGPTELGTLDDLPLVQKSGRFGAYLVWGDAKINLPPDVAAAVPPLSRDALVQFVRDHQRRNRALGEYNGVALWVRTGRNGPYLKWGDQSASLPPDADAESLTYADALRALAERAAQKQGGAAGGGEGKCKSTVLRVVSSTFSVRHNEDTGSVYLMMKPRSSKASPTFVTLRNYSADDTDAINRLRVSDCRQLVAASRQKRANRRRGAAAKRQ